MQYKVTIYLEVLVIPIFSYSMRFFYFDIISDYRERFDTKCYLTAHGIYNIANNSILFNEVLAIKGTNVTKK